MNNTLHENIWVRALMARETGDRCAAGEIIQELINTGKVFDVIPVISRHQEAIVKICKRKITPLASLATEHDFVKLEEGIRRVVERVFRRRRLNNRAIVVGKALGNRLHELRCSG